MLHNNEHALIMYLHGRALEEQPATLYYAFPADQASPPSPSPTGSMLPASREASETSCRTCPGTVSSRFRSAGWTRCSHSRIRLPTTQRRPRPPPP